jgi:hypothetical protein
MFDRISNVESDSELKMRTMKFILREVCRNYRVRGDASLNREEVKQRLRGLGPEYLDLNIIDLSKDSGLVKVDDNYDLTLTDRGIEACKRGELLDIRLRATREPRYLLKSRKARKVTHTLTQSLIGKSTLSFLVFGPGKRSKKYLTHRVPVKNLIEELDQNADFPEDIRVIPESNPLAEALADNVATRELDLMRKYDYTIILLFSVGSISEYSQYVTKSDVAYKIRLCVPVGST